MTITAKYRDDQAAPCAGCTAQYERDLRDDHPDLPPLPPSPTTPYWIAGRDFSADLCDRCALLVVKALAAVIVARSPEGRRDLRRFFGVSRQPARRSRKEAGS